MVAKSLSQPFYDFDEHYMVLLGVFTVFKVQADSIQHT